MEYEVEVARIHTPDEMKASPHLKVSEHPANPANLPAAGAGAGGGAGAGRGAGAGEGDNSKQEQTGSWITLSKEKVVTRKDSALQM